MKEKITKPISMLTIMLVAATFLFACKKADVRDDYVGSYHTESTYIYEGTPCPNTYTLTITKSSTNEKEIILNNIDDLKESIKATVDEKTMSIPLQTIQDRDIRGSGTLEDNVLKFSTHEILPGGVPVTITQTATKQ
jgi:hypothetical protein